MWESVLSKRFGRVAICAWYAALLASGPLLPSAALAQEREPAAAQALFDQAKQLSKQGKYGEACPKLQESNRLDPGIGTQFHLADCYERSGRVASAWATFLDVASQARATGQLDRETAAIKRAENLESRLPRLVVNVPEASRTPGLEIRRNGMLVGAAQWGAPVPVDPGELELVASAPGRQSRSQSLRLEEGKTASYGLPQLELAAETAAAPESAPSQPAEGEEAKATTGSGPGTAPTQDQPGAKTRNGMWIATLTGVGVVGLGVGTAFAVMAKGDYTDSKQHCDPGNPNQCARAGVEQRNTAIDKGNVASVAFIAGGAALAGAGLVWLLSGSADETKPVSSARFSASPALGPGHASLHMQGSF